MRTVLIILLACPFMFLQATDLPAVPAVASAQAGATPPPQPAPTPPLSVEAEDLFGIWQGRQDGISYTLIIDPRVDGAALMSLFTNGHGFVVDTSEAGTARFDGNHLLFHVMRAGQRIRTRRMTVLHLDAKELTLAWDRPRPEIVQLHRLTDTLPAR